MLAFVWGVSGCTPAIPSDSAAIESVGILAAQARQPEAVAKLKRWSEQGNGVAQRELALALLKDPETRDQGLSWLERAARNDDAEAAFVLGDAVRMGRFGLKPDVLAARPWLERSAQHGHADAALALARLASNGEAGARDARLALQWLRKASEAGNTQAMFLLSNAYAQGQGTPVALDQARYWLEAAADKHFSPAIQAYALVHLFIGGTP